MARRFLAPIELPGDPGALLHAAPKQYVDGVRTAHEAVADPHPQYLTQVEGDGRYSQPGHTHAADAFTSGTLDPARLPRVSNVVGANSVSTSTTSDASTTSIRNVTVTGSAVTVGVPLNGADRQILRYAFYASVATTITFNTSIRLSTGLSSRAFTVPQGQVLLAALEFADVLPSNKWVLTAATVSAT